METKTPYQRLQSENFRLKAENTALRQRLSTQQRHNARKLNKFNKKKDAIAREIACLSGIQFEELWDHTRAHRISRRRQEAMYIMQEFAGVSSTEAGSYFGMHHATALYARQRVEMDLIQDQDARRRVATVVKSLQL